jgi:hypothetical protein
MSFGGSKLQKNFFSTCLSLLLVAHTTQVCLPAEKRREGVGGAALVLSVLSDVAPHLHRPDTTSSSSM